MKKCKGCEREIDKHSIACQYCGILIHKEERNESSHSSKEKTQEDTNE